MAGLLTALVYHVWFTPHTMVLFMMAGQGLILLAAGCFLYAVWSGVRARLRSIVEKTFKAGEIVFRQGDFDFLRAYEGTHWMSGAGGERAHLTEKNARDAIAFLEERPRDRPFALTVGFFAPHAEDNAPEQYLPQDWSAKLYEGVTIPPPLRGLTRGQFVLNLDVAPTLVAAAGIAVPGVMQGRDLGPLYLGARAPGWRDEFFYEHPTVTSRNRIPSSQGVVRRDWKYIEWPEFDAQQLFDLRSDPGEVRNLAGQPSYAGRQRTLRQQLDEWRRRAR